MSYINLTNTKNEGINSTANYPQGPHSDLFGKLDVKRWEATAAQFMPQLWFTDCQSVYDTVRASVQAKAADKRLGIELAGLRQNLWRAKGEAIGNPLIRDELPVDATDSIRWIDTEVMLADPMTKNMEADKLIEFLSTNWWDTSQPIESVLKKTLINLKI
mgnify:CR=1 FL=1